jgi:hypothetical protein
MFEARDADRAELTSYGTTTRGGKRIRTDEGVYIMPFKMMFQANGCQ